MTVLITGGSGFLGSRLACSLVTLGYEVSIFSRSNVLPPFLSHIPIKHIQGDIRDPNALANAMVGYEVVFHMAGLVSYRKNDRDKLYAINVIGTRNVMEASLKANVKRVIHLSSIAAMGIPEPRKVGCENIQYNLQGLGLYYCDTKHDAELEVLNYAKRGLPVLLLNPGITFGAYDTHPHHHAIFKSLAKGYFMGCPAGGVTFSDIEDVTRTAINAITIGRPGERYVVGSANLTFKEAAEIVCQVLKKRPPLYTIPGWLSAGAGMVSEAIFPLFGQQAPLTWQAAWLSDRRIFFSSCKAMEELGHVQTPFEETVKRTVSYYLGGRGDLTIQHTANDKVCY